MTVSSLACAATRSKSMPGCPASGDHAGNVSQVLVFMASPRRATALRLTISRRPAGGAAALNGRCLTRQFLSFIDTYGQFIHRDWPGKVHGPEDIEAHRVAEERIWRRCGPLTGTSGAAGPPDPQLNATGFFRTEKYADKWWLVDPTVASSSVMGWIAWAKRDAD